MVRSRWPNGSDTVGASSKESTSASVNDLGSDRPIFGMAICAVGSSAIKPSRTMKRKNRRKLDNCLAVDRGRDPPSTRAAMKPNNSMRVALSNALSRSSNQRASASGRLDTRRACWPKGRAPSTPHRGSAAKQGQPPRAQQVPPRPMVRV
jgi:hypothetical protein